MFTSAFRPHLKAIIELLFFYGIANFNTIYEQVFPEPNTEPLI